MSCRRQHVSYIIGNKIVASLLPVCCWIQRDTSRPWHKWIVIMLPRYSQHVSWTSNLSTIRNRTDMGLSKCTFVQISNILKVCVQNVIHLLECKLEDVDANAWPIQPGGNVLTLDQVRLQRVNVTNPAAVHTLLQLTPNLVVYRVEVRTFSWPQSWNDEVWC